LHYYYDKRERERSDRVRIRDADDADDDEDSGSDDTEYDENGEDIQMLKKLEKRAARREKRRLKLKQDDEKQEVHKAKKLVGLKNKSGEALAMAKLQNQLGVMGCLACRATQCKWQSNADMEVCTARLKDLGEEINRVRADKDEQVFVSNVGELHTYCVPYIICLLIFFDF
jgi:seryl-tRNA synthetase